MHKWDTWKIIKYIFGWVEVGPGQVLGWPILIRYTVCSLAYMSLARYCGGKRKLRVTLGHHHHPFCVVLSHQTSAEMFGLPRRRREAQRQKHLKEQFAHKDQDGHGRITAEQMMEIFEENKVSVPNLEEEVAKLQEDGSSWIRINDFMKFALTTDLCQVNFQDRVFHKRPAAAKSTAAVKLDPCKVDKLDLVFQKLDLNHDGYLSRDEFYCMMKNASKEQSDRLFRAADTSGDNKISLAEFRAMLTKSDKVHKK